MRTRFRISAYFSKQTVQRKALIMGLLLGLPSLFLIFGTVLLNSRLTSLVSNTIQVNEENELLLDVISNLDSIQLLQSRLLRLATLVSAARYEPYSDELLYPEITAAGDEQKDLVQETSLFFLNKHENDPLVVELASQLESEINTFRISLESGLRTAVSDYTKLSESYQNKFQELQNLITFYDADLEAMSATIEQAIGDRNDLSGKAYLLRLSRSKYTQALLQALLDRNRPYIDEKYNQTFATEKKTCLSLLSALELYVPGTIQSYRKTIQVLHSLEETEFRALLSKWSLESGLAELKILREDKVLTEQSEDILKLASYLASNIQEDIRASAVQRSVSLSGLRNWSGFFFTVAATLGFLALLFSLFFYKVFEFSLVQPLLAATAFAGEIQKGAHPRKLQEDREDEFGVLARALNRMDDETRKKTDQLEQANKTLEENVAERTKHLSNALTELSSVQEELIMNGKLATLGQLSANMAHELNTPLGAILSADRSLIHFFLIELIPTIQKASTLSAPDLAWFLDLVERLSGNTAAPSLDNWTRKKHLVQAFSELGAQNPREWADIASEIGLESPSFFWPPPMEEKLALELLEIISKINMQRRLALIVGDAAEKAAYTVSTLKAYLHGTGDTEYTEFDLSEEIRTVLDLFHSKLAGSVDLVLDLEEGIRLRGIKQSLSQVWTNLITNALQAMNYSGILTISSRKKGSEVRVLVKDSGQGIPEEVLPKIFDPFFTTKKSEDGVGLGLDICRSIIIRHGGTIEVESRPGNTTFSVILPGI